MEGLSRTGSCPKTDSGHLAVPGDLKRGLAVPSDGVHHLEPDVVSGALIFTSLIAQANDENFIRFGLSFGWRNAIIQLLGIAALTTFCWCFSCISTFVAFFSAFSDMAHAYVTATSRVESFNSTVQLGTSMSPTRLLSQFRVA